MPKYRVLDELHHFLCLLLGFSFSLDDQLFVIWTILFLGNNDLK